MGSNWNGSKQSRKKDKMHGDGIYTNVNSKNPPVIRMYCINCKKNTPHTTENNKCCWCI